MENTPKELPPRPELLGFLQRWWWLLVLCQALITLLNLTRMPEMLQYTLAEQHRPELEIFAANSAGRTVVIGLASLLQLIVFVGAYLFLSWAVLQLQRGTKRSRFGHLVLTLVCLYGLSNLVSVFFPPEMLSAAGDWYFASYGVLNICAGVISGMLLAALWSRDIASWVDAAAPRPQLPPK